MAFYNPNKIEFNPNTMVIEKAGALGRSLYDIYNDNVERKQKQAKLNETNRHNMQIEAYNQNTLDETINNNKIKNTETARHNETMENLGFLNTANTANHYTNQHNLGLLEAGVQQQKLGLEQQKIQQDLNKKINDSMNMVNVLDSKPEMANELGITRDEINLAKSDPTGITALNILGKVEQNKNLKSLGFNVNIKRGQLTQAENSSLSHLAQTFRQADKAKALYKNEYTGAGQVLGHKIAQGANAHDMDMVEFRNAVQLLIPQVVQALTERKIFSNEAKMLSEAMPDINAWTDKDFNVKFNNIYNLLQLAYETELQGLKDNNKDVSNYAKTLKEQAYKGQGFQKQLPQNTNNDGWVDLINSKPPIESYNY